ncbi:MAG: SDR family NAD(P)-dependent oxidoreductase [Muribaculaceae bacterium]|nr:SDR family NAD(P)-dependent oxidoreductase [Muribaculaceae bacterium]
MNKTAVVIGAGSGLGLGLAKKFKNEGFKVVLVARNEQSLKEMAEHLGEAVFFKTADASDAANLKNAIDEIKNEYGTPDVVLYNVGITTPDSDSLTAETLVEHFKADVAGAYTTATCFSDEQFVEKRGAIIFTGGGLAMYPADGFIPLSLDKAALRTLAYILHDKYKKHGIFVGIVEVCGTINGSPYFSADNIAESYWRMYLTRDKCEYAYETPELSAQQNEYGTFENKSAEYWGAVYKFSLEDK